MSQRAQSSTRPNLFPVGAGVVVVVAVAIILWNFFLAAPKRTAVAPPVAPAVVTAPVTATAAAAAASASQSTGVVQGPDGVSVLSWRIVELAKHGKYSKVIEANMRNDASATKRVVRVTFTIFHADGSQSTVVPTVRAMQLKPGATQTAKFLIFDNDAASAQLAGIDSE